MNFLRKILLIAIITVLAGNAEGMAAAPVLDFDNIAIANITSQFQPEWHNAGVVNTNAPNDGSEYIYFTIIPAGGIGAIGGPAALVPLNINVPPPAIRRAARPPIQNEINIYFPMDGHQPTTPEAISWSCANIDNRPDSPITEWYMKMFGVIPFQNTGNPANDYVKAGWSPPAHGDGAINAQRIISFDTNCAGLPHDQCSVVSYGNIHRIDDPNVPGTQISRRALFEREFRKIASTSVGRVLLYRILIEVRRHTGVGNNNGCQEHFNAYNDNSNYENNIRNIARSIVITYGNTFSFNEQLPSDGLPDSITFCNLIGKLTCIGRTERQGITRIVLVKDSIDISIVHEMIHWFHSLRNIRRKQEEFDNYDPINKLPNPRNFTNYYIGKYYWRNLNYHLGPYNVWNRHEISEMPWMSNDYIRFEEIRTILGFHCDTTDNMYIQGDDLSENLYRMCVGFPLRFGYCCQGFFEDRKVINRVINACFTSYVYYMGSNNRIERYQQAWDGQEVPNAPKVEFNYNNDTKASAGLGHMKYIRDYHFHVQQ